MILQPFRRNGAVDAAAKRVVFVPVAGKDVFHPGEAAAR